MENRDEIYTVNDLMNVIAEVLNEAPYRGEDDMLWYDRLDHARSVVSGWLQPDQERDAQMALIDAAMSICDQL